MQPQSVEVRRRNLAAVLLHLKPAATGKDKGFAPVQIIGATGKDKEETVATLDVNLCNVVRALGGGGALLVPGGHQGGGGQVLECRRN